jgi:hypothetical protein
MVILVAAAVYSVPTSTYATGGGWSETDYYDDDQGTNWVGGRRIDGCNPQNGFNLGTTSAYKEVSSDSCDGGLYSCARCIYWASPYNYWYCDYVCTYEHG